MSKLKILILTLGVFLLTSCNLISHDRFVEIDSRNEKVPVEMTKGIFSKDAVFNVKKGSDFSKIDIFRCLCQAAKELKDNTYEKVYLAKDGEKVFYIDGTVFAKLGEEYANGQNPIYLLRTFPQNVKKLDGSDAFSQWSGGWLGVMNQQMEDVNRLFDQLITPE